MTIVSTQEFEREVEALRAKIGEMFEEAVSRTRWTAGSFSLTLRRGL